MNTQIKIQTLLIFVFLLYAYSPAKTQITLNPDETITVRSTTNTDRLIPDDVATITISLKGGDGGKVDFATPCNTLLQGGEGASAQVTYPVDDTGDALRPGGILRFYAGQHGQVRNAICSNAGRISAAGGGSSAILYLPPGESASGINWVVLAIAGGGSGAARPFSGNKYVGKGGRAVREGGSVTEDGTTYVGGDVERCPNGFARAGNKQGRGGNIACGRDNPQDGGCVANNYTFVSGLLKVSLSGDPSSTGGGGPGDMPEGGDGFSGGGTAGYGSGAGGGVGGGAHSENQVGGAGGSFVQSAFFGASNSSITAGQDGGGHDDSNVHGFVTIATTPVPYLARCRSNVTIELDANGETPLQTSQIDNGSILPNGGSLGLAGGPYLLPDDFKFFCNSAGSSNQIRLLIFDMGGSIVDECFSSVTVADVIAPTTVCQDVAIQLDENGTAVLDAGSLDGGSSDNCAVTHFSFPDDATQKTYTNCVEAVVQGYTETLKVTDASGNAATCTSQITIEDNIPPVLTCKDITVELGPYGESFITERDLLEAESDNCSFLTYFLFQPLYCSSVGQVTVTLAAYDQSDNTGSCESIVTVVDNTAPTALAKDIAVQLGADGNAAITAADVDDGSFDFCGVQSMTVSPNTFACYDLGDNTVTLTVTDVNGNAASATAVVTIEDNFTPVALCKNNSVVLDANGEATISAATIDNGSYDNCTTPGNAFSLAINRNSFDCTHVGPQSVVLTITDHAGLTGNCTATVNVIDNKTPTLVCPQDKVVSTNTDDCTFVVTEFLDFGLTNVVPNVTTEYGWYTDNCNSNPLIPLPVSNDYNNADNLSGAIFPPGTTEVTWSVTDPGGNVASCTFTVTVEDGQAPALETDCPGLNEVNLDADPNICGSLFTYDTPAFVDDCDSELTIERVGGFASGEAFPIGTTEFYFTATDQSGNTNEAQNCLTRVTVSDAAPPVAECVESITVSLPNDGGNPAISIQPNQIDKGSYDVCGSIKTLYVTGDRNIDCNSPTENIVTLVAEDVAGNTGSCQTTVIFDDEPPTAECKDITVDVGSGSKTITAQSVLDYSIPDAFSVCHLFNAPEFTIDRTDFNCSDIGSHIVTLTVTDYRGRTTSCQSNVEVADQSVTSINCGSTIQVQLNEGEERTIDISDRYSASDLCGGVTVEAAQDIVALNCNDYGLNQILVTATDESGNTRTCNVRINVFSDWKASCRDITVELDENGEAPVSHNEVFGYGNPCPQDPNISDYETYLRYDLRDNTPPTVRGFIGNGFRFDENNALTFTSEDVGTNNIWMNVYDSREPNTRFDCTANITVVYDAPPIALCQDISVSLDENGSASILPEDVDAGSYDDGAIVSRALDITTLDCDDIQNGQTVVLTLTDDAGKTSDCEAHVEVVDDTPPTMICKDVKIVIVLDDNGSALVNPAIIDDGSFDNCAAGSNAGSIDILLTCLDANTSVPITYFLEDGAGNVGECTRMVQVVDATPPIALCRDITVNLNASGVATITAAEADNGSSDNCGVASLDLNKSTFGCNDVSNGASAVLTVFDLSLNTSTCTSAVTVLDPIAPTALCQDATVQLDANGNGSLTAAQIDAGSADACGIADLALDKSNFDCSDVGNNTVILTVTDSNGNASSCSAAITVSGSSDLSWQLAPGAKLWPPDYSYQTFTISDMVSGLSDGCGEAIRLDQIWIEQATSDEVEDDPGTQDGNTLNDIVVSADCRSIQVRKERMGGGNGRVYTVTLAFRDAADNTSYADYKIQAPKWAWGWNSDAVEDGAVYSMSCGAGNAAIVSSDQAPRANVLTGYVFQESNIGMEVYPNPFHSETNLKIYLPEAAAGTINVFNLQGQIVRQLKDGLLDAGEHQLQWDGTDTSGKSLPSGMYLIQMQFGEKVVNKKVLLQRL